MHTFIIISYGIILLVLFQIMVNYTNVLTARRAVRMYIVIWLPLAFANLLVGVFDAGYGLGQELPLFLLVFGLPSLIAILVIK